MEFQPRDRALMQQAIAWAWGGQGHVEPNPMVGCVIARGDEVIGRSFHKEFGGPHAEINAMAAAGGDVSGTTVYVTLEPCSFTGKTGPCADALVDARVKRVVIGCLDPNPKVSGRGVARLQKAGVEVTVGVEEAEARSLIAPFAKGMTRGLPWIVAKWAMTIDGKIATMHGDSQWISNEHSRNIVQEIRGRVDGIMVGCTTADRDDPLLTARGEKSRTATRIVVDSLARIRLNSNLVATAGECPVIIVASPNASQTHLRALEERGVEVWVGESNDPDLRLMEFLHVFHDRGNTNLMVEGGGTVMGSLAKMGQIDEAHVFVGPKMLGGRNSITPVEGPDPVLMAESRLLNLQHVRRVGDDVYMQYRRDVTANTGDPAGGHCGENQKPENEATA